jgi:hypothetical protein
MLLVTFKSDLRPLVSAFGFWLLAFAFGLQLVAYSLQLHFLSDQIDRSFFIKRGSICQYQTAHIHIYATWLQLAFMGSIPTPGLVCRFKQLLTPLVKHHHSHGCDLVTIHFQHIIQTIAIRRKAVGDEDAIG